LDNGGHSSGSRESYGEKVIRGTLVSNLQTARFRSDELFKLLQPEALYERPIQERHRLVFYLGHLEAFDWNLICSNLFKMDSLNPAFDRLFAFCIDPTRGDLPQDQPEDWPCESEVRQYCTRVRETVDRCLSGADDDWLFRVAIEHRLMHAETLAYMLHWLPFSMKHSQPAPVNEGWTKPIPRRQTDVPSGIATLGMPRNSGSFGWDNEFDVHQAQVPAFSIDVYKVTNGQYLDFVSAGGYEERSLWSAPAWEWLEKSGTRHPRFWALIDNEWICRTMFANVSFQPSWPVYVSHAEAEAYARWAGKTLPTEAQYHRAAFGTREGTEREFPWGNHPPERHHGNFDFRHWNPTPVDAHPDGNSAFGIADLVGNGWEWTCTPFEPFPGFKAFDFYPGYSADFFDGKHYVMKGGSPRTSSLMLRRSFRNWFQPFYPNIYASFRCVEN
jgi:iron(II)-dependent oxidoreductase